MASAIVLAVGIQAYRVKMRAVSGRHAIEVSVLQQTLADRVRESDGLKQQGDALRDEFSRAKLRLTAELTLTETQKNGLREELTRAEMRYDKLNAKASRAESQLAEARVEHAHAEMQYEAEVSRAERQQAEAHDELAHAKQQYDALKLEVSRTESQHAAARDRLTRAGQQYDALKLEMSRAESQIAALRDQIADSDRKTQQSDAALTTSNAERARLEQAIKASQEQIDKLGGDLAAAEKQKSVVESQEAALAKVGKQVEQLKAQFAAAKNERDRVIETSKLRFEGLKNDAQFASEELGGLLDTFGNCEAPEALITNVDFNPPIPFVNPSESEHHRLAKAGANLIDFVDQTSGGGPKVHLIVAQGQLTVHYAAANSAPEIHDGFVIVRRGGKTCKQRSRLTFLPALAADKGVPYQVMSVLGRRGDGIGRFTLPYGSDFRADNGNLLITDCTNNVVQEFTSHGDLVNILGVYGTGVGKFNRPTDVKFVNGNIFVVEDWNYRYQIFDGNGDFKTLLGAYSGKLAGPNDKPGLFNDPLGIAVADDGTITVVDYGNDRLQAFDRTGRLKFLITNRPGDAFQFNGPYHIEIDPSDKNVLVTNRGNNEVVVLSPDGQKLAHFGSGVLNYPHELAIGKDGRIYVADTFNHRLAVFRDRSENEVSFVNFPESWGLPKTVALRADGVLAVGFSNAREAFIALLSLDLKDRVAELRKSAKAISPVRLASAQEAYQLSSGFPRTTYALYEQYCSNCHENGNYGAPKRRHPQDWERFSRSADALVPLALAGNGAMMRKGGCESCSESEVRSLIEYMLPDWTDN